MLRIIVERAGEVIQDGLFGKRLVSIGRDPGNDVVLNDPAVSALHLVVKQVGDSPSFRLIDQSWNGTFIGENKVAADTLITTPTVARIVNYEITIIPAAPHDETAAVAVNLPTTDFDELPKLVLKERSDSRLTAELRLLAEDGAEHSYSFTESAMIGRTSDCDVQLVSRDVSRQHCHIFSSGTFYLLRRLSTVNGCSVNGRALDEGESVRLNDGDVIRICDYELSFYTPAMASRARHAEPIAEANPNHDLTVTRRTGLAADVTVFEVIGFLGSKTFAKFESELLHEVRRLRTVIIDFGYLIGVDAAGIASIGKVVREASRSRTAIRLIRFAPRVSDILEASPLSQVLLPYVSRSEESAIKVLRQ